MPILERNIFEYSSFPIGGQIAAKKAASVLRSLMLAPVLVINFECLSCRKNVSYQKEHFC